MSSDTELVALLHDDDYLLPEYLCYVKRILDSELKWDCILFDHEFEVNGVLQKNETGRLKKLYTTYVNEKYRKVSEKEYLIGGYNYISIPTCGILYRKSSIVRFGGYVAADGYSADEQFVERFVRKGGKVLYVNKKLGVYTYRSNKNLSSNFEIQKGFVYENIKHRNR